VSRRQRSAMEFHTRRWLPRISSEVCLSCRLESERHVCVASKRVPSFPSICEMAIYTCEFGPVGSGDGIISLCSPFFGPFGLFFPFGGFFVLCHGALR
jgi:hypothetical protein